ncbi:hypothetical protein LINGRAHAP2_LOCUS23236 [Linum grandiflorum]
MDSRCASHLLSAAENDDHQHKALIYRYKELQSRVWEVKIELIYREANTVADHLAHLGHYVSLGVHTITVPSADLLNWVLYDKLASLQPRLVLA